MKERERGGRYRQRGREITREGERERERGEWAREREREGERNIYRERGEIS